jgi:hypothetical protein
MAPSPASTREPSSDGYCKLAHNESIDTVSEVCRAAGLSFMRGAGLGWGKRELARWLAGPYATATRHSRKQIDMAVRPKFRQGGLSEELVTEWLAGAQYYTTTLLKQLEQGIESGYVDEAIVQGYVAGAVDEVDTVLWVPVDLRDMRLKDRVRSVFVADFLNVPLDYTRALYMCPRCGEPSFDEDARRAGVCTVELSDSGIRLPRERDTQKNFLVG